MNLVSNDKVSGGKETHRDCFSIPAGEEQVSSIKVVIEVENGTARGEESRKSTFMILLFIVLDSDTLVAAAVPWVSLCFPSSRHVAVPEVSVDECRLFPPALPGIRLKETVVDMDRVGQVQPALLVTWRQAKMKPVQVHRPSLTALPSRR